MRHRTTLACSTALAALAAPAAAQAATIAPNPPCVRSIPGARSWAPVATGFTPGATITVKADDQVVASGVVDAAGNYTAPTLAPDLETSNTNEQAFSLTASDGSGVAAAPTPLQVVRLGVDLPDRARPRSRVRYRAFGFAEGKRIYLHVRRNGRTRGRFSLGNAAGPCGKVTKRMRYMPLRGYSTGTYEYWFSQDRRYSKSARIYGVRITIFRR